MPYSKEDKLIAYSKDETKEQEVKIRLVISPFIISINKDSTGIMCFSYYQSTYKPSKQPIDSGNRKGIHCKQKTEWIETL